MKVYKTEYWEDSIKTIMITKKTKNYVYFYENNFWRIFKRKVKKHGDINHYVHYWDTFKEAKDWIIKQIRTEIQSKEDALIILRDREKSIESIKIIPNEN